MITSHAGSHENQIIYFSRQTEVLRLSVEKNWVLDPRPRSNRLADETVGKYGGHTWLFAFLHLERLLYHHFSADFGSLDGCCCFKLCFAIDFIDDPHGSVAEAVLYRVLCVMFHSDSDKIADQTDGMLRFDLTFFF